jgi:hypothetical protein
MLIRYDCRLKTKIKNFWKNALEAGKKEMGKKVLLVYLKKTQQTTASPQDKK